MTESAFQDKQQNGGGYVDTFFDPEQDQNQRDCCCQKFRGAFVQNYVPTEGIVWATNDEAAETVFATRPVTKKYADSRVDGEYCVFSYRDLIGYIMALTGFIGRLQIFMGLTLDYWTPISMICGVLEGVGLAPLSYYHFVAPATHANARRRRILQYYLAVVVGFSHVAETPYFYHHCEETPPDMMESMLATRNQTSDDYVRVACMNHVDGYFTTGIFIVFIACFVSTRFTAVMAVLHLLAAGLARLQPGMKYQPANELATIFIIYAFINAMGVFLAYTRRQTNKAAFEQSLRGKIEEQRAEMAANQVDALLSAMVPHTVLPRLMSGESHIIDSATLATILFSDIKEFTKWSSTRSAEQVVHMINVLIFEFDSLAEQSPGIEKVKTIGDAYWAICGLPEPCEDHATRTISFGLEMLSALRSVNKPYVKEWGSVSMRVGIHSGPVRCALLGTLQRSYEPFGATSDDANMVEHLGVPDYVTVTKVTKELFELDAERREKSGEPDKHDGKIEFNPIAFTNFVTTDEENGGEKKEVPLFKVVVAGSNSKRESVDEENAKDHNSNDIEVCDADENEEEKERAARQWRQRRKSFLPGNLVSVAPNNTDNNDDLLPGQTQSPQQQHQPKISMTDKDDRKKFLAAQVVKRRQHEVQLRKRQQKRAENTAVVAAGGANSAATPSNPLSLNPRSLSQLVTPRSTATPGSSLAGASFHSPGAQRVVQCDEEAEHQHNLLSDEVQVLVQLEASFQRSTDWFFQDFMNKDLEEGFRQFAAERQARARKVSQISLVVFIVLILIGIQIAGSGPMSPISIVLLGAALVAAAALALYAIVEKPSDRWAFVQMIGSLVVCTLTLFGAPLVSDDVTVGNRVLYIWVVIVLSAAYTPAGISALVFTVTQFWICGVPTMVIQFIKGKPTSTVVFVFLASVIGYASIFLAELNMRLQFKSSFFEHHHKQVQEVQAMVRQLLLESMVPRHVIAPLQRWMGEDEMNPEKTIAKSYERISIAFIRIINLKHEDTPRENDPTAGCWMIDAHRDVDRVLAFVDDVKTLQQQAATSPRDAGAGSTGMSLPHLSIKAGSSSNETISSGNDSGNKPPMHALSKEDLALHSARMYNTPVTPSQDDTPRSSQPGACVLQPQNEELLEVQTVTTATTTNNSAGAATGTTSSAPTGGSLPKLAVPSASLHGSHSTGSSSGNQQRSGQRASTGNPTSSISTLSQSMRRVASSFPAIVKVKTIGNTVMLAGSFEQHKWAPEQAAEQMIQAVTAIAHGMAHEGLGVAAGIHVGPVVGCVLGLNRLAFDVFGDAVNVASRVLTCSIELEQQMGEALDASPISVNSKLPKHAVVHVSEEFLETLQNAEGVMTDGSFGTESVGLNAKGKGTLAVRRLLEPVVSDNVWDEEYDQLWLSKGVD